MLAGRCCSNLKVKQERKYINIDNFRSDWKLYYYRVTDKILWDFRGRRDYFCLGGEIFRQMFKLVNTASRIYLDTLKEDIKNTMLQLYLMD